MKNILRIQSIITLILMLLVDCQTTPNYEKLKTEILELHKAMIEAHFNKNFDYIVQDISDNYMFVSNGEVTFPTRDKLRSTFSDYLNNTTFTEYKDLQEPIIGFSKDASLGLNKHKKL